MSDLLELLATLAKETRKKRTIRHSDPARGLEYNKINPAWQVSKKIWKVDIARTPQVIRNFEHNIEMHGEAYKANKLNLMVNYRLRRAKGR